MPTKTRINDLASQVCDFPFFNPQTGLHIEGAEPGDTRGAFSIELAGRGA